MRVISPVELTDAMVTSNIAEPDTGETAWNAATNYTVGQVAARFSLHRLYTRKVAGVSATPPEDDPVNWDEDYLPTNKWAMFDQIINTKSRRASPLTVTLAPGFANSLALLELEGDQVEITGTDGAGGPVVYSRVIDLDTSVVTDLYEYFFEPFTQLTTIILTDLPPYNDIRLTVTVTSSGMVGCGQCIPGSVYSLGGTQRGVTTGVRSFSKKKENLDTGITRLKKGVSRRSMRARLEVTPGAETAIHQLLNKLLDTACVWLGDDTGDIEPLVVYGFSEDFELEVQGKASNYYSLSIQGMA